MAPDLVGTIPQWLTLGGVGGILGIVLRYRLGWRKQTLDSDEQVRRLLTVEMAALRSERATDKEGALRVEKHLREMIELSDHRHEECEAARVEDRKERAKMQDDIDGLKRQIPQASANLLLQLEGNGKPSEVAPHSTAAAKRIKENGEGGK